MAKKTKRASKKPIVPPREPEAARVVINPFGPTKERPIKGSKVVPSWFRLSDGTKLYVTPRVSDVRRAIDQYNQRGEPLYFLTIGQFVKTVAPKKLWKKTAKSRKAKAGKRKK